MRLSRVFIGLFAFFAFGLAAQADSKAISPDIEKALKGIIRKDDRKLYRWCLTNDKKDRPASAFLGRKAACEDAASYFFNTNPPQPTRALPFVQEGCELHSGSLCRALPYVLGETERSKSLDFELCQKGSGQNCAHLADVALQEGNREAALGFYESCLAESYNVEINFRKRCLDELSKEFSATPAEAAANLGLCRIYFEPRSCDVLREHGQSVLDVRTVITMHQQRAAIRESRDADAEDRLYRDDYDSEYWRDVLAALSAARRQMFGGR